jgi:hypothetical protein
MRWTAPHQDRNLPISDNDGTTAMAILDFAEGQVLAKSRRQSMQSIMTGLRSTTDMPESDGCFRV